MRDVLLERVRPLVDRLADDLTELAVRRVEAEIERMAETFAVALSAYASDGPAPDVITAALGPELAQMLDQPKRAPAAPVPRPEAAICPPVVPPRAQTDGHATDKPGNRMTCKACGFVGGNARGCGRSHPTQGKAPATGEAQPARAATPARLATIAAAAKMRPEPARPQAREPDDDDGDAWPRSRIATETARAESAKREGALPRPLSSYVVTPPPRPGEYGDVEELDFEAG